MLTDKEKMLEEVLQFTLHSLSSFFCSIDELSSFSYFIFTDCCVAS